MTFPYTLNRDTGPLAVDVTVALDRYEVGRLEIALDHVADLKGREVTTSTEEDDELHNAAARLIQR